MSDKIRVTIWNEFRHEKSEEAIRQIYPNGIHAAVRDFLSKNDDMDVRIVSLDEPSQGLPDEILYSTDVLLWWGHMAHGEVDDGLTEKIRSRVYDDGMGFIAMHSAHMSKPFRSIVGTSGKLLWGDEQKELMWNILPSHPIAAGIPEHFELEREEMYGEPFAIPTPDDLIFLSWYEHGHVFRAGCTFYRGRGKVFYFQPGHESCRSFYHPYVQTILTNAVRWAKPNAFGAPMHNCDYRPPIV